MEFFLNENKSEWKAAILEYARNGQIGVLPTKIESIITVFSNAFQPVKDVLHSSIGAPWSAFSLIKNSRNAITNNRRLQLINTFHCGRYSLYMLKAR